MEDEENEITNPWQVNGAPDGYLFGFDMEEFENAEDFIPPVEETDD